MCYDIVTFDKRAKKWNVLFYNDVTGDGSGFELQNAVINLARSSHGDSQDVIKVVPPERAPEQTLTLLPIQKTNFVRLGVNKGKPNGEFGFSASFNLFSKAKPIVILGFSADYVAPDGCFCLNLQPAVQISGRKVPLASNDHSLKEVVELAKGTAQVVYGRTAQPPFMMQTPEDCDNGDLRVSVSFLAAGEERTEVFYFKYEVGGILVKIDRIREPPLLSDLVLSRMRTANRISEEEFERAKSIRDIDRYRVVAFPDRGQDIFSSGGDIRKMSEDLKMFLIDLNRRAGTMDD